jgi:hypothetical protein
MACAQQFMQSAIGRLPSPDLVTTMNPVEGMRMTRQPIVASSKLHGRRTSWLVAGALAAASLACSLGGQAPTTPLPATQPAASGQNSSGGAPAAAATQAPAAAPSSGRDFNAMDACAMFPGEAVAKALDATQADPPSGMNFGAAGVNCSYSLIPGGASSGIGKIYNIYLFGPEYYDINASGLENAQPIQGLGDQAAMGYRSDSEEYDLIVLKNGDISIEVLGDDANLVQKLAEYVMANL